MSLIPLQPYWQPKPDAKNLLMLHSFLRAKVRPAISRTFDRLNHVSQ